MAVAGKKFPREFLWGSATSAYQVEGGNLNSDWEVLFSPKAGLACDHYHRFAEDFDLAKSLNQNAHRLSIEWARIEPEKGRFSDQEITHYREVLTALKERGIRPLVTLHHFTNPLWFFKRGGWENPSAASYFTSFVRFAVTQLKDLCDFWITVNEPAVYAGEGYLWGHWLPGKHDPLSAAVVLKHLLEAHREAYDLIHDLQSKVLVGISYNLTYFRVPGLGTAFSAFDRKVMGWVGKQDFLGINYYRAAGMTGDLPKSDLDWAIYPKGLSDLISDVSGFGLPIYITENGIADADDDQRADFIADHLAAVWRAIQAGADVRGYFYWSLMDNFEWARGFGPRFGLAAVDYKTMERTVRPSARIYARIAKQNHL